MVLAHRRPQVHVHVVGLLARASQSALQVAMSALWRVRCPPYHRPASSAAQQIHSCCAVHAPSLVGSWAVDSGTIIEGPADRAIRTLLMCGAFVLLRHILLLPKKCRCSTEDYCCKGIEYLLSRASRHWPTGSLPDCTMLVAGRISYEVTKDEDGSASLLLYLPEDVQPRCGIVQPSVERGLPGPKLPYKIE